MAVTDMNLLAKSKLEMSSFSQHMSVITVLLNAEAHLLLNAFFFSLTASGWTGLTSWKLGADVSCGKSDRHNIRELKANRNQFTDSAYTCH